MSLINEALKKAQTDRPDSSRPKVPMEPGDKPPVQKPPKKKRYLFGFVLSVLVVGLLSALVSTYLVLQLLGQDDETEQPAAETTVDANPANGDSRPVSEDVEPEIARDKSAGQTTSPQDLEESATADTPQEPVPDEAVPEVKKLDEEQAAAEELVIDVPEAVESEHKTDPKSTPVAVATEPEVTAPRPVATTESPVPAPEPVANYASANPDPQIWQRLEDFEIRGIMSGGAKVLIYDTRSQKARTYTSGDLVDGALSLRIASISGGEIQFTNNEGTIFTKAF